MNAAGVEGGGVEQGSKDQGGNDQRSGGGAGDRMRGGQVGRMSARMRGGGKSGKGKEKEVYGFEDGGTETLESFRMASGEWDERYFNGSSLVTVFAPTNAAYAAMAGGHWPRNNSETLQRLLLYHCAYGDIVSSALKAAQHIQVSGPKMQQLTQIYTITDCCLVAFCTWIPTTRLWTDKAYS